MGFLYHQICNLSKLDKGDSKEYYAIISKSVNKAIDNL